MNIIVNLQWNRLNIKPMSCKEKDQKYKNTGQHLRDLAHLERNADLGGKEF